MKYEIFDISEIRARLDKVSGGRKRYLILIGGLPGVGKTTLAREFVRLANAVHFEIDEVKREVVPAESVTESIDPPEYRFKYYEETIRRLPELFDQSPSSTVVIDETFHLQEFREMWSRAARDLNIKLHWIETVCEEEMVKERLQVGKDRGSHILGEKAFPMHCMFKEVYEPMDCASTVVDTCRDLHTQIRAIIEKLIC